MKCGKLCSIGTALLTQCCLIKPTYRGVRNALLESGKYSQAVHCVAVHLEKLLLSDCNNNIIQNIEAQKYKHFVAHLEKGAYGISYAEVKLSYKYKSTGMLCCALKKVIMETAAVKLSSKSL